MSNSNNSLYSLTHMVLYHYFVAHLQCPQTSPDIANKLCDSVLRDAKIVFKGVKMKLYQSHCYYDLLLEQSKSHKSSYEDDI